MLREVEACTFSRWSAHSVRLSTLCSSRHPFTTSKIPGTQFCIHVILNVTSRNCEPKANTNWTEWWEGTCESRSYSNISKFTCSAVFSCKRQRRSMLQILQWPCKYVNIMLCENYKNKNETNSVAWVRELTIPTERPPLVGEVNANFLQIERCSVLSAADPLRP
jgi:hypothetical protein